MERPRDHRVHVRFGIVVCSWIATCASSLSLGYILLLLCSSHVLGYLHSGLSSAIVVYEIELLMSIITIIQKSIHSSDVRTVYAYDDE
mgnify:FL=1